MTTISADINRDLKAKLSSKAAKEGKSVSELIKEALNSLDLDKEEFNEVDEESKMKENLRNEVKEAIPPLQHRITELEKRITTLEQIDRQFYDLSKSIYDAVSKNKQEFSKAIDQLITGLSRNSIKIGKLNTHIANERDNIKSIKRDLLDAQHRLMNKGVEVVEGVAKRLK